MTFDHDHIERLFADDPEMSALLREVQADSAETYAPPAIRDVGPATLERSTVRPASQMLLPPPHMLTLDEKIAFLFDPKNRMTVHPLQEVAATPSGASLWERIRGTCGSAVAFLRVRGGHNVKRA